MRRFPKREYHIPFFDEYGYIRRLCPTCKEYFWTQNPDQKVCEESTSLESTPYTFINDPPTRRHYSLREMREAFLSFFEKRNHKIIKPYPVVARWRDDLYFTHASIINFQPYVTEGITPPPANPLVISQPCIRLIDVDNVGPTFGRHLTIFEMGGHHAFNRPDKEVYWKDETVRYHHEFVTKELGVKSEEVIYKEGVWIGGGNAGPDVESIIRGIEVATLVFMKYKVVDNEFIELPVYTVDTGYGMERFSWLSQGSVSCFHAIYNPVLKEILKMAEIDVSNDLLEKAAKFSGLMSLGEVSRRDARKNVAKNIGVEVDELERALSPIENVFAVVDHTKCLIFMLTDGIVPSNVREGYLARLMLRRTYKSLIALEIEERLLEIIDLQIKYWLKDFPRIRTVQDEILEILSVERDKFKVAIKKGRSLIKRVAQGLKVEGVSQLPEETLIELYDSHGLPPEIVQEVAEEEDIQTSIPENFYMMVAERHIQTPLHPEEAERGLKEEISDLPETQQLYYEDPTLSEFDAKVIKVIEKKYVVLDKTAFYPEGGGQSADHGYMEFNKKRSEVVDVQKIGNNVIHHVKGKPPPEGSKIRGTLNWERRANLMKHHTSTHILMGAARRVLGEHVWQAGAQKNPERSRLDISHFKRLTMEEICEIERLANQVVMKDIPVEVSYMLRERAEALFGFRLYQGGEVPGRRIRVVNIEDWEVQACGGIHCKTTGEVGFIKVVHTERIQDGVERIIFCAGLQALTPLQEKDKLLWELSNILSAPQEKLVDTTKRLLKDLREARRRERSLIKEIAKGETQNVEVRLIKGVKLVKQKFDEVYVDRMIETASELVKKDPKVVAAFFGTEKKTARIVIMAGKEAVKRGVNSGEIAQETSAMLGGGGSGRPDFAQGGGVKVERVSDTMKRVDKIVERQLEG